MFNDRVVRRVCSARASCDPLLGRGHICLSRAAQFCGSDWNVRPGIAVYYPPPPPRRYTLRIQSCAWARSSEVAPPPPSQMLWEISPRVTHRRCAVLPRPFAHCCSPVPLPRTKSPGATRTKHYCPPPKKKTKGTGKALSLKALAYIGAVEAERTAPPPLYWASNC